MLLKLVICHNPGPPLKERDHLALLCVLSTIYLAYVSTVVAKGCYYHAGPFCALSTANLAREIAIDDGVH